MKSRFLRNISLFLFIFNYDSSFFINCMCGTEYQGKEPSEGATGNVPQVDIPDASNKKYSGM